LEKSQAFCADLQFANGFRSRYAHLPYTRRSGFQILPLPPPEDRTSHARNTPRQNFYFQNRIFIIGKASLFVVVSEISVRPAAASPINALKAATFFALPTGGGIDAQANRNRSGPW
jgi:hypothetical protein